MAKKRNPKIRLSKALEQAKAAVLLVDAEFVIRFANDACCEWVDISPEEIVGLSCVYSSAELDNPLKNRVAGLCPPPTAFEGNACNQIVYRTLPNGERTWRHATFSPLNIEGQPMVMVTASTPDMDTDRQLSRTKVDRLEIKEALSLLRSRDQRIHSIDAFVGKSSFAARTRRQIIAAIENRAETLIIGHEGTGREFCARTIFQQRSKSSGKDENLFPIHCAIADGELIQQTIKQWIEDQQHSTQDCLLLLEADQMDTASQNELLGFVNMPGIRIQTLATSQQSLIEMAKDGKYSADLANYLSTQTIETVPLAKRREDIPLLVQAFIERANVTADKQIASASPATSELLAEYNWPRNMDQLNDTIQHAIANSKTSKITPSDLPEAIHHAIAAARVGKHEENKIKLDEFLEEVERKLIVRALRQTKNTKSKAAVLLGISRPRLLRRLEALKINVATKDSNIVDSTAFKEEDESATPIFKEADEPNTDQQQSPDSDSSGEPSSEKDSNSP